MSKPTRKAAPSNTPNLSLLTPAQRAALVADLVPDVAARVVQQLAAGLVEKTDYSTRTGHGPSGYAERIWKKVAPTIPGARRPEGSRWTFVSREAFEAWERGNAPAAPASSPMPVEPWSPASALKAAGLRGVAMRPLFYKGPDAHDVMIRLLVELMEPEDMACAACGATGRSLRNMCPCVRHGASPGDPTIGYVVCNGCRGREPSKTSGPAWKPGDPVLRDMDQGVSERADAAMASATDDQWLAPIVDEDLH